MRLKNCPGKIIIPPGVFPEKHELMTANALVLYGDVEFILPSRTKGVKNADIVYLGKTWEMKCPRGKSKTTILNAVRCAIKQSTYIIIDLRLTSVPESEAIKQLKYNAKLVKRIKRTLVIDKSGKVLEI